jgi:hypothetical protein
MVERVSVERASPISLIAMTTHRTVTMTALLMARHLCQPSPERLYRI